MNQETDRAETEKKPKTFLVHRIEPGCSPIDRMQSGPPTGWSPEGVGKSIGAMFFFIGAEPRVMNQEIDQAETEKKPKTFLVHRIEPGCSPIDRMQSGPPTGWSPEGVRKIDRCNVFFIGAEPRVMNQEIDQAETEKKTQNIPGSPDRTRMQSNRPDAVRTTDRMESGRCRKIDRCNVFFHRGRTSSNEPGNRSSRNREKNPKHSWFTGSNPDAVQSTGCSPDHRPDGVRKVSGKSIGAMFFFIGAEPRVMNQEIDRAETEKKTRVIRSRVGFEARTS